MWSVYIKSSRAFIAAEMDPTNMTTKKKTISKKGKKGSKRPSKSKSLPFFDSSHAGVAVMRRSKKCPKDKNCNEKEDDDKNSKLLELLTLTTRRAVAHTIANNYPPANTPSNPYYPPNILQTITAGTPSTNPSVWIPPTPQTTTSTPAPQQQQAASSSSQGGGGFHELYTLSALNEAFEDLHLKLKHENKKDDTRLQGWANLYKSEVKKDHKIATRVFGFSKPRYESIYATNVTNQDYTKFLQKSERAFNKLFLHEPAPAGASTSGVLDASSDVD
jgi:hypothetical protein